jgi:hypothetical protein
MMTIALIALPDIARPCRCSCRRPRGRLLEFGLRDRMMPRSLPSSLLSVENNALSCPPMVPILAPGCIGTPPPPDPKRPNRHK